MNPAEYLEKYPGGASGVRFRLGHEIRIALSRHTFGDISRLADQIGVKPIDLHQIAQGDNSVITEQLVDALDDPLNIDVPKAFGKFASGEADPGLWSVVESDAKAQHFSLVGGANDALPSKDAQLRLFAYLQAFRGLGENK